MPRITAAIALALVSPLPAQENCLAPPERALVIDVVLGDLPPKDGAPGLANLWAVPGLRHTLLELWDSRPWHDSRIANGIEPANLDPILLARLGTRRLARMQFASTGDSEMVIFDVDAGEGDAAATAYDAVVAECKSRGLPVREDALVRDARRVVSQGSKGEHWVLQRGRQIASGSGAMQLELRPRPPKPPGASVRGPLLPSLPAPRTQELADFAVTCGFDKDAQLELDVATDAQGYRQAFLWRGKRAAGAPTPRPLGAAPRMPRLNGQFLIARGNVDPEACLAWALAVWKRHGVDADNSTAEAVAARCSGEFAVGIAAPALGGIYPRVAMAVRLRPGEDFIARLRAGAAGSDRLEVSDVEGVPTAMVTLPNVPAFLRPSFCVLDDVLWLAESLNTLRAVRKAIGTGDDVFADAEATPCPCPPGATALVEAWFDCEAIHGRSAKVWGTLPAILSLVPDLNSDLWRGKPIAATSELPDPSDVAPTLGRGRAVLYASGDECGVRVAAPAIGPLLSLVSAVVLPMTPTVLSMGLEQGRRDAAVRATQARATRLGVALRAYRSTHQDSMPATPSDLVALLPPGDPHPLLAPHGPERDDLEALNQFSFQRAPANMTAVPVLAQVPAKKQADNRPVPPGPPRSVFAFCGFGYLGHHLLILADGEVTWVPSDVVLEHVLPGRTR